MNAATQTDALDLSKLECLLPKIEAAEEAYWSALGASRSDDHYQAAVKAYNLVLQPVVAVIHEATAHVNSYDTLEQVFRPYGDRHLYFSAVSPLHYLQGVVRTGHLKHRS